MEDHLALAEPVPYPVTAADFNGDGILDVAVADYLADQIVILLGTPGGTWELGAWHPAVRPVGIEAADLDGDGSVDLLVASQGSGGLQIMYGTGRGTFELGPHLECARPRSISICDVNGDGFLDVVVSAATGITVFISAPRGRSFTPRVLPTAGLSQAVEGIHPTLLPHRGSRIWTLTSRERQVAQLACLGYSAGEIGRLLGIGRRTVETYLATALSKLGLRSKRQLERGAPWGATEDHSRPRG